MSEQVTTRELLLHLLSRAVEASDTTQQLYRDIDRITNGISATLQSEGLAEYIATTTYDYAIFCNGEIVADVEGDFLIDENTAHTVRDFLQAVNPDKVFTVEQVKIINDPYGLLQGGDSDPV